MGSTSADDSVSYTYDANGNVLTSTDKNGTIKREIDALNRVIKYEDTFGNTIDYRYDPIGNLSAITYPDGTEVRYEYDANNNLVSVTDWEDRKTVYTYDANNRVTGVIKPDGSVTATEYDNAGRVISTVEKNARGVLITGFEYTYDILGRVSTEKHLDKNVELCYTYDERSRVTQRTKVNYNTGETTDEAFTYDAAGNIITTADNCDTDSFSYDKNNRLTYHNGMSVTYDADGNMTSAYHDGSRDSFRYDSTNRLIGTNTNAYTYNAENVRIRNLCGEHETTYVYNTNAKLSSMLMKTTDGVVTKYVYGRGLIGEETNGNFKVYHFDYRGSTVAITDINGNVTDRFEYDTYGKLTSRTGNSDVIFLYNGRDGVVTDANGLIYMRARYYSPELRRFINADILAGRITNAVTLNRYAYTNANPVSLIDPRGLAAERSAESQAQFDMLYDQLIYMAGEADRTRESFDAFFDYLRRVAKFECADPVGEFERLTMEGTLDRFLEVTLGAYKNEETGAYHIRQDGWQSFHGVGYNDLYDLGFSIGTAISSFPFNDISPRNVLSWIEGISGDPQVDYRKFKVTLDGEDVVIWAWKGDYVNLGAGAELGIYRDSAIPGHFLTAPEEALHMRLILKDKSTKETLYRYTPDEKQWWITGFDPSTQGRTADDLEASFAIDFSDNTEMMDELKAKYGDDWKFYGNIGVFTF